MSWIFLFLLLAEDPTAHAARVRAAMQPSLAKQRLSLARLKSPLPCAPVSAPDLTRMIDATALESGVDPHLILEVARQESAFHPCAVSSKGAAGLMQLMPATQVLLNVHDPFNPQENLAAGTRLLKELLLRYNGNLSLALSAYNAGPAKIDPIQRIPPIPETQNYVAQILSRLSK